MNHLTTQFYTFISILFGLLLRQSLHDNWIFSLYVVLYSNTYMRYLSLHEKHLIFKY